jgi:hypothetical protein
MSRYTDGELLSMRAHYEAETAWAPPSAAAELRQIRGAMLDMQTAATRAQAEADLARKRGQTAAADRHAARSRCEPGHKPPHDAPRHPCRGRIANATTAIVDLTGIQSNESQSRSQVCPASADPAASDPPCPTGPGPVFTTGTGT